MLRRLDGILNDIGRLFYAFSRQPTVVGVIILHVIPAVVIPGITLSSLFTVFSLLPVIIPLFFV